MQLGHGAHSFENRNLGGGRMKCGYERDLGFAGNERKNRTEAIDT